jgi:hypothetical protein
MRFRIIYIFVFGPHIFYCEFAELNIIDHIAISFQVQRTQNIAANRHKMNTQGMHPNFNDGMTTKVRLALVPDGLKEIFRRFREDVDPPVFELRDKCIQMLRSVKLLKMRRYTSNQVGVHPKNRYGDGIIPGHVVSLVEKFTLRGFSEEDLGIPRATELPPPGHARREEFVRFCNLLAEKSGGILPMYGANEIEIVSGQKSHTSQACRCVLQGAACENELIAADGRCSLEKVRAQRPSFAKVCEEGMEWEVVPWEVEDGPEPA